MLLREKPVAELWKEHAFFNTCKAPVKNVLARSRRDSPAPYLQRLPASVNDAPAAVQQVLQSAVVPLPPGIDILDIYFRARHISLRATNRRAKSASAAFGAVGSGGAGACLDLLGRFLVAAAAGAQVGAALPGAAALASSSGGGPIARASAARASSGPARGGSS